MRTLHIAKAISAHASAKLVFVLMLCLSTPLIGSAVGATDKKRSNKSKAADTKKSKTADKKSTAKNSRNNKKREDSRSAKNSKNSKNKKEDKRATTAKRGNKKEDKRTVAKREEKNSRNSRNSRNSKNRREVVKAEPKKDLRKMSKKERAAELRRRRAEEAARRRAAEEARRRAIEEARRREAELKAQSVANIQNDDISGEDMEIRRTAVAALGDRAGTVVVMNPKTGQVYSVVNQEWGLRKGFKPCSTIKLLTGAAGLTEGEIVPETEANYSPYKLNLVDALAFSNNPYFQSIGGRVGFEKMKSYAKDLGLGEKTGINMPNESPGAIPQEKTGYAVNHMSSHGDDFEITPIQLATMVSAIGNGGFLLKPHVVKPEEKAPLKVEVRRRLSFPQKTLEDLLPGMAGAVNFGTAKGAQTPGYYIAGKTGTCTGQGTKLGLFASYGPVGDPQLAVVVITRGSGQKGKIAAGVAGQIYRALSYRFTKPKSVPFERIPMVARQRNTKPVDTEEDDDTDATSAQQTDANGTTTDTNNVQKINKTYEKNAPTQQQQKPLTQPQVYQRPKSEPAKPVEEKKKPVSSNIQPEGQRPRIVKP